MKVSKEDIIGVSTALEYWFEERDHAAERQKWYDDLRGDRRAASRQLHGVRRRGHRARAASTGCRGCKIVWDRWQYPLDGLALRQRVLDGEPRVMLDDNSATENSIAIDPFQLQPGEAAQVGDAVVAALREATLHATARRRAPPAIAIAGDWELRVDFLQGARIHRLSARAARQPSSPAISARRSSRGRSAAGSTATRSASASARATRRARSPIASRAESATAR